MQGRKIASDGIGRIIEGVEAVEASNRSFRSRRSFSHLNDTFDNVFWKTVCSWKGNYGRGVEWSGGVKEVTTTSFETVRMVWNSTAPQLM